MRLRVVVTNTGWAVVDRDGGVRYEHPSWLSCVSWLNGYDQGARQ